METLPDVEILLTADHGMSFKSRMIHLPEVLGQHGISAQAVPIIKDLYTVHHSNLGGCIYVYLDNADLDEALAVLRNTDGIDEALPREEAFKIPDLIRTKINLLPPAIQQIRTVNIVGLDLQADGGIHVANTKEVGRVRVVGHESKGRINKRLRIEIDP